MRAAAHPGRILINHLQYHAPSVKVKKTGYAPADRAPGCYKRIKNGEVLKMSDFENCSGNCGSCGSACDSAEGGATVTLTLDDGSVLECAVLTVFPAGDKEYIALLPLNENGQNEDGEVFLYRFTEENGEPQLDNIEDDEEYEIVADAFDELLDSMEFDEIVGEDELN